MLDLMTSPDDVISVKISGKITGEDLDTIMDRLDAVMAGHDKVHVFVEAYSITSLELAELPGYFARAAPLLGKLSRFGRVAVVADQAWLRAGTRLESALLPSISYRVFTPDQRDAALAWAEGKAS